MRVNGEVRLRPDAVTDAVKEVWVRSVAINGWELLLAQISKALQSGGGLSGDVARESPLTFVTVSKFWEPLGSKL